MAPPRVAFAANASYGAGGQGEFLRMMTMALADMPGASVYSRHAPSVGPHAINLPFIRTTRASLFNMVLGVPVLRGRHDWLTLLSDLDFDSRVAAAIDPPDLFDGVMAQCDRTIARLKRDPTRGATCVVVTCLNTHISHLADTLADEYRRAGAGGVSFVHPRMVARALREIAAADHIRVNSEVARQTFIDRGIDPSRVTSIHPGIDLDHFQPSPKPDDVFRVLAVSSIDPRKGIHYLLEAFVKAAIPRSELILYGGTGDRWSRRLIEKYTTAQTNVHLRHADITRSPSADVFGPASVLVHAAVEDGFGLVVPQALASGRPVIATRTSGASELIRNGVNGFVVDARAVDQLVDRLRQLSTDSSLWQSMCGASRPSVAHLTYAAFARDVQAFYARVCALAPRR